MSSKDIEWTVELENILLKAMAGKRPVSFVAHFSMASILKIFNAESGLNVSAEVIWAKLNKFFKLDLINEKTLTELPRSFRERKNFDLFVHPQFKKTQSMGKQVKDQARKAKSKEGSPSSKQKSKCRRRLSSQSLL